VHAQYIVALCYHVTDFHKKQEKINKRKSNPLLVIIGDNWEGISLASKADSESGEKEGEAHP
jgi:hypothetical protein